MQIFIQDNQEIVIDLFLYEDENKKLFVYNQDNLISNNIDAAKTIKHTAVFRYPTFSDHIDVVNAIDPTQKVSQESQETMIGLYRLVKLLKNWTFMDENNLPVQPTGENIMKMNPKILSFLISEINAIVD